MSQNTNPANTRETSLPTRNRIPMSMPQLKLAVEEIPGYVLHWMRGDYGRLAQAQRAGYEFVTQDEVNVTNTDLAGDAEDTGNTDLGTRVSINAGKELDTEGQPSRLYLMKLRKEFWDEDQQAIEDKNELVAQALRGGSTAETAKAGNAYIPDAHKGSVQNLFHRKK